MDCSQNLARVREEAPGKILGVLKGFDRTGRYPEGFIVDDGREGIYAGRGE